MVYSIILNTIKTITYKIRFSRFKLYALCFPLLAANPATTDDVEPGLTNIILQSKDGGRTWQDISYSLPENEQPEDFFAGASELYLRVDDGIYRSNAKTITPSWEKENVPDPGTSIVFNRSGVMAFNYEGHIYKKTPAGTWMPIYTNFQKHSMRTIFETAGGILFLGYDNSLCKSADKGQHWKQVLDGGGVGDLVESEGVLIGTSQKGIIRSTDNGEHWELVISEGGVGIAVERIDSGFAAIAYSTTSKSRRIFISSDRGKTWKTIDEGLQPSLSISSIKQMGRYLICGHPEGIFRSADMGKTWDMVHRNVDRNEFLYSATLNIVDPSRNPGKVFKIYVSGNVLYAVARLAGC